MECRNATLSDFETAFAWIQQLWSYRTYDRAQTEAVYRRVLANPDSFFFFLEDQGVCRGMCHGDYFDTFWMQGPTCYVSSLFVDPAFRGQGCGAALLRHAEQRARARGCRALILDSGLPRVAAHQFYEHIGFEKSCYGFEKAL